MSSESRVRLVFRSRLARIAVAAVAAVGLAAVAAVQAGAGPSAPASGTLADDERISPNHNQALV